MICFITVKTQALINDSAINYDNKIDESIPINYVYKNMYTINHQRSLNWLITKKLHNRPTIVKIIRLCKAEPIPLEIIDTVHSSFPEVTSFIQAGLSSFMPEWPDAGEI